MHSILYKTCPKFCFLIFFYERNKSKVVKIYKTKAKRRLYFDVTLILYKYQSPLEIFNFPKIVDWKYVSTNQSLGEENNNNKIHITQINNFNV